LPACAFDADQLDGTRGGLAGFGAVMAHEAALAHAGLGGQGGEVQVEGQVFRDPRVQLGEAAVAFLQ